MDDDENMVRPEKRHWMWRLKPGRLLIEAWVMSAVIVSISNVFAQLYDAHRKEVGAP
jgi:hypothetical protein